MDYDWDEEKRLSTIQKHGLDFYDASVVFDDCHLVKTARMVGNEVRLLAIGLIKDIYVTVVFTERPGVKRVITMRRARNNERDQHKKIFGCRASCQT